MGAGRGHGRERKVVDVVAVEGGQGRRNIHGGVGVIGQGPVRVTGGQGKGKHRHQV